MKKFFIGLWVTILLIAGLISYFWIDRIVEGVYTKVTQYNNKSYAENSIKTLESNFLDIPLEIKDKVVLVWNPKAEIVIINTQWWPMTKLSTAEAIWIIEDQSKIDLSKETLLVNVHQCQTLETKKYETEEISFKQAKQCDKESVKYLAETVKYFKSKNKKVYVLWISFGALMTADLLANYPNIADKYLIVVGRLNMPKEVWKEFSEGHYVGFEYDETGKKTIIPFNIEQAGMWWGGSIWDQNTSKLAAGLWHKRYIELLKDKNLKNVVYAYWDRDEQVWRLTKEEIDFLKSKDVTVIKISWGHSEAIDGFSEKYLKSFIK